MGTDTVALDCILPEVWCDSWQALGGNEPWALEECRQGQDDNSGHDAYSDGDLC